MNYKEISAIIDSNNLVDLELRNEAKMNKRNNPLYGRVTKHTCYLGVSFGANYSAEVNKRRIAEGKEGDFKAQKSIYEDVNKYFVRKGEQLYLRLILDKDVKSRSIFEVDGRPATEEEVATIKAFMPTKSAPKNQGLSEGNEVQYRVVKIENIVAVGNHEGAIEVA